MTDPLHIPRRQYGVWMAGVSVLAIACAAFTTWMLGGNTATISRVALATTVGSIATFTPAVLNISREYWGVGVLGAGMLRSLACMGWAYVAQQSGEQEASRAIMLGTATGVAIVLAAETAISVSILARIERAKSGLNTPTDHHPRTAVEQS
jgi:hypothetical protein